MGQPGWCYQQIGCIASAPAAILKVLLAQQDKDDPPIYLFFYETQVMTLVWSHVRSRVQGLTRYYLTDTRRI